MDILEIFNLEMDQISSELLKSSICNMTVCLSFHHAPCFMTFLLRYVQKSKFWDGFWMRKWPTFFGFLCFKFFFCSFYSHPHLFAAVIGLLLGLLPVQKILRKHHQDRQILPWICHAWLQAILLDEFFSWISEHFCAYFRLHWANHFDLVITGKISSSCRTWEQVMPILVKGDNIRRETKANACHGR